MCRLCAGCSACEDDVYISLVNEAARRNKSSKLVRKLGQGSNQLSIQAKPKKQSRELYNQIDSGNFNEFQGCVDSCTGSQLPTALIQICALRSLSNSNCLRNFFGDSSASTGFDPAKQLGVQDPIGFWDPLGLSADKDEATFKRRRAVEIKHGRIVGCPVQVFTCFM